jgi:hypothetical protein
MRNRWIIAIPVVDAEPTCVAELLSVMPPLVLPSVTPPVMVAAEDQRAGPFGLDVQRDVGFIARRRDNATGRAPGELDAVRRVDRLP